MNRQIIKHHYLQTIGIVVAVILCALIPTVIKSPYYLDLLIVIMVNAVLAMTFLLMLRTGLISLGISAFFGVGAYVSAVLVMKLGLSFWISLPLTAVITGIFSLILGYFLIGSGGAGLGFVMLSSVIAMMFTVVVGSIQSVGGYSGLSQIPPPDPVKLPFLPLIEFTSKVPFFYLALILLVLVLLVLKAFYGAWTGRAWTAVGLSPRLAESIGVDVFKFKLLSFVVASAIAGLVGSFYAHYQAYIVPDSFAMWRNIYYQLYAILGGVAFPILGPLLGTAVMTLLPEFLRIAGNVAQVIIGAILILLILFFPGGLLGLLNWREMTGNKAPGIGKTIKGLITAKSKAGKT